MDALLADPSGMLASPQLYVRQQKEWAEILVDYETANRYEILDGSQRKVGMAVERSGGVLHHIKRLILRSHRPLHVDVTDAQGKPILQLSRSFFWFFSDLNVRSVNSEALGGVFRRFGILYKKYDLRDARGQVFARIEAPLWRIWTFPLFNAAGTRIGEISKKWSGFLREAFTDADVFLINFGEAQWREDQRAVILAAALSVDFDFFEENQGASSALSMFD